MALGVDGLDGFEEWLEGVHDEPEWSNCDTVYSDARLSSQIFHFSLQYLDFDLSFPCTLVDVWSAVHVMQDALSRHQDALYLSIDGFGDPDDEADGTSEVAWLLSVSEPSLLGALGGPWVPVEGTTPEQSGDGDLIYHWFARGEPESVWFGIGGDDVYIESVTHLDDGTYTIKEEWPWSATLNLLAAEARNEPLTEGEFLQRLQSAVEAAERASDVQRAR